MNTYSSGDIEYFQDPEVKFTFKYFSLWTPLKVFSSFSWNGCCRTFCNAMICCSLCSSHTRSRNFLNICSLLYCHIHFSYIVLFLIYSSSFTHRKTSDVGLSHSNIYREVRMLFKEWVIWNEEYFHL